MKHKKAVFSAALIIFSIFLFFIPPVEFPFLDRAGKDYFHSSLKGMIVTYSSVRGLNAVVSIIKDSEIDLSPGGVGVVIAAGEIVDPIDDLIERFSSILLFGIASISIQKLIMIISANIFFKLLSVGLIFLALYVFFEKKIFMNISVKIVLFAVLLRFILPISAVLSDITYNTFLKSSVETSRKNLSEIFHILKFNSNFNNNSLVDNLKNINKSFQIEKRLKILKENSSKIVDSIIVLITAFLFQTVLIPVAVLWIFMKTFQWIFKFQTVV